MKYYLGIDGGGTKTSYTVIDENKKIVLTTRGENTSYNTNTPKELEKKLLTQIESLEYTFSSIFAGMAGVQNENDALAVEKILKKTKNLDGPVKVDNDVINALKGTIPSGEGIVIIAGTGSVAYGVNGNKRHIAGGYGYKEGDAGSAFSLGQKSLSYLARVLDKRLPESSFSRAIENVINCHNPNDLCSWIISADRIAIANLAPIVTSYAKSSSAKQIIDWAVNEILLCVNAVFRECGFKECKLAIVGSLGNARTYYKERLLKKLDKKIQYVHGLHDAGLGSALLAYELANKK